MGAQPNENFIGAKNNREMVASEKKTKFYLQIEAVAKPKKVRGTEQFIYSGNYNDTYPTPLLKAYRFAPSTN